MMKEGTKNLLTLFVVGLVMMLAVALIIQHRAYADDVKTPDGITLTKDDNGRIVNVKRGDVVTLQLEGNATTGYWWHFDDMDSDSVKLLSESTKPASDLIGAPSMGLWRLAMLKAGTVEVTMRYYRMWEGKEKAVKTFSVTFRIE